MNRAFLLTGLAVVLSLTLGLGCLGEAPHDNPLDPNSDRFVNEGGVAGRVTDRAEAPLVDAEVRLMPAPSVPQTERVARTDADGRFEFRGIPEGTGYRLQVVREGYTVGVVESIDIQVGMVAALPVLR